MSKKSMEDLANEFLDALVVELGQKQLTRRGPMNRKADQNSVAFPIAVLAWLVLSLFCLTKFGNADSIDNKEDNTRFPQGTADGLVVLVHGCCTNSDELEEWENLRVAFQEGTLLRPFYEFILWDWTSKTYRGIDFLASIKNSYDAAYGEGIQLAQAITNPKKDPNHKYTYVHFIAHSAGSRVIYSASKFLKAIHPVPPFIHTTFLDAYTHADTWDNENPDNRYHDENRYACFSDFAEHYVDRGLPSTDQDLANAYNFDVSNLEKPLFQMPFDSGYGWPNEFYMFYHYFPVDWYQRTVENFSLSFFGAPNAIDFVSSPEHPKEAFYSQLEQKLASPSWNLVPGSRCLLGESLDTCEKEDFPPISVPLCTLFENDPDPTPSPENGVPVITRVNFPPSITGDGQEVPGTVQFTDSNAGVNWAQFDVVADTCGGCFTPFAFDPEVSEFTEGEFGFVIWCTTGGNVLSWTMRVTLRDVEGHVSDPVDFSIACEPPQSPPIARSLNTEFENEEQGGGSP